MNILRIAALSAVLVSIAPVAHAAGRDPFRSPFAGEGKVTPATGLQAFALADLQVEGIISGVDSPRAVIVLPTGEAVLVKEGTRIGTNGGRVKNIERDAVVVAEPAANRAEELTRLSIR